jgi:hypothetical protein
MELLSMDKEKKTVFTIKVVNRYGFEDILTTTDKIKADKHLLDALFLDEVEVFYKKEIITTDDKQLKLL